METTLITGGAGYIGSHTAVELIQNGNHVIIVDNLSNSDIGALDRIEKITGVKPDFYQTDVCNKSNLLEVFKRYPHIDNVIHFAAFKAVGESVEYPLSYYRNNLFGLITLLECMNECGCDKLVFSSSCTVYGQPDILPVTELTTLKPAMSPYGNTKKICEDIIIDYLKSNAAIKAVSLRYFNPVGAHLSSELGELPAGVPNNLMPYITQTAIRIREFLMVFGNDYNTPDGTAIRDYIHVSDLATAHLKSLYYLSDKPIGFYDVFNIGTGEGYSVLQVIDSITKFMDKPLKYKIVARRPGDIEKIWADSSKSNNLLGWFPKYGLDDMTRTALEWEKKRNNMG
jgi:UDP-glucose 4-epimerase